MSEQLNWWRLTLINSEELINQQTAKELDKQIEKKKQTELDEKLAVWKSKEVA